MLNCLPTKLVLIFLSITCTISRAIGLSYDHFSNEQFASIHVLVVNPNEHTIIPVRALEKEISRETVATLANRYGAVAAINGGFWKANGAPAGALKINREWLGTPSKPRGAIGWSLSNKNVLIDRILTNYTMSNCPSKDQIKVIPISAPPHTSTKNWNELEHIVGGTPILVQNGSIIEDFSQEQALESFLINRHPRTAVGIKNSGDWVFVVVDASYCRLFGGMTIKELAKLMLDLGCIEALNLDGGGSSTMVIDGEVINEPCGKLKEKGKYVEEVSDAILIF